MSTNNHRVAGVILTLAFVMLCNFSFLENWAITYFSGTSSTITPEEAKKFFFWIFWLGVVSEISGVYTLIREIYKKPEILFIR